MDMYVELDCSSVPRQELLLRALRIMVPGQDPSSWMMLVVQAQKPSSYTAPGLPLAVTTAATMKMLECVAQVIPLDSLG